MNVTMVTMILWDSTMIWKFITDCHFVEKVSESAF
jgi:hypothetical protein